MGKRRPAGVGLFQRRHYRESLRNDPWVFVSKQRTPPGANVCWWASCASARLFVTRRRLSALYCLAQGATLCLTLIDPVFHSANYY